MQEIRLLCEEQARRETEMATKRFKEQLSRSQNITLNDATARSLNAAQSGDVFSMARNVITIASGSAHVASRGTDAIAGEDTDTELGLKLKPDTYNGSVPLREFFAQFKLTARASRWNETTKTITLGCVSVFTVSTGSAVTPFQYTQQ